MTTAMNDIHDTFDGAIVSYHFGGHHSTDDFSRSCPTFPFPPNFPPVLTLQPQPAHKLAQPSDFGHRSQLRHQDQAASLHELMDGQKCELEISRHAVPPVQPRSCHCTVLSSQWLSCGFDTCFFLHFTTYLTWFNTTLSICDVC